MAQSKSINNISKLDINELEGKIKEIGLQINSI